MVGRPARSGQGNVRNLGDPPLEQGSKDGTPIVLLDSIPIAERDFTAGRATELWQQLHERATVAASYDAVVAVISARVPTR